MGAPRGGSHPPSLSPSPPLLANHSFAAGPSRLHLQNTHITTNFLPPPPPNSFSPGPPWPVPIVPTYPPPAEKRDTPIFVPVLFPSASAQSWLVNEVVRTAIRAREHKYLSSPKGQKDQKQGNRKQTMTPLELLLYMNVVATSGMVGGGGERKHARPAPEHVPLPPNVTSPAPRRAHTPPPLHPLFPSPPQCPLPARRKLERACAEGIWRGRVSRKRRRELPPKNTICSPMYGGGWVVHM